MSQIDPLQEDDIKRTLGVIEGRNTGRHAVYFTGMHGNEPAGIHALKRVLHTIEVEKIPIQGKLWALEGNLPALRQGIRYLDRDLNRIWFTENNRPRIDHTVEATQKKELQTEIKTIVDEATDEVIFFDLHTTSAQSVPFVSISDTLRNRKIIEDIPVPLVLGLEEQMEGTLFNFFSEIGISMVLFEAGQHDSIASVDSHEAFIWLTLVKLGFIRSSDLPELHVHYEVLAKEGMFVRKIFQLKYKHLLSPNHDFKMMPGFVNFQKIRKKSLLANEHGKQIRAPRNGRIFMPLYQPKGEEGFFILEEVNKFWLKVSVWVRKRQLDHLIALLPGIKCYSDGSFIVNRHVARVTVVPVFHLLGYRVVTKQANKIIVKRRPYDWQKPSMKDVRKALAQLMD